MAYKSYFREAFVSSCWAVADPGGVLVAALPWVSKKTLTLLRGASLLEPRAAPWANLILELPLSYGSLLEDGKNDHCYFTTFYT